ncbi:tyrosine-type recombinase/integrase [Mycolicibacterium smegmatis]|uniref:tyrosine-type recombinase/integrase n=1 Tax=Mycolicibacterium smegmatis TaxID=1772 RepID=UPI0005D77E73|nr:site-specific integrase [Mycolicibacterium smegmatis]MDF1899057.1 tyrosine-type recombinase/integrase [Mycolicibacterium smegmatis]MDF1904881.1 tyrosine-type recombinase/integrase [Mycolicibacterium smegmatis]MDF1918750.1 tyrosine-type recombinase/integrase [Mycolicibacterium smegmatis]MDF1924045.1 tyrosine-type recombinase/integrase [Mycolicibacterium smegmatis]UAK53332.1 site-specific integrase [Mycolicibacterium smegmatis]
MSAKRNIRAGLDDRWTKRVKGDDGVMRTVKSAMHGKGKRWRVRWVDDDSQEHTKVFDRKPDAQAFLNKITADIHRGEVVSPKKGRELFEVIAEDWLLTKSHRKPKTVAGYRELLDNLILPRWGHVPVKDITYEDLVKWLGKLSIDGSRKATPLSPSRIRQTHQCVHAVLQYAVRTGKVPKNVAADIERKNDLPNDNARVQHALTHDQLLGLVSKMGLYATLTLVLGYTGIRLGEASALRREGVRDGKLMIRESATRVRGQGLVTTATKTNKMREVAVPPPVWERLVAELPTDPRALVFPNRQGEALTNHQYRYEFDKAVAAMKAEGDFPSITPHDLRHTCASLLISSGANIKVVQRQLGHATATMTLDRYGHLYDADLTAAANKLGEAIRLPLRYDCGTDEGKKKAKTG